jgi:polypeptide N-acetylgalactosaminyltransferase
VGTAFAINRQNFWDLGSYDDGLKIFQGENLDLSFKAQLCGIGILEVPCSRIAHSYRSLAYYSRFGDDGVDYMIRNFKRIAETWLDEYKDVVFKRNSKYASAETGNMIRPKTIKRGLHCKPFRYFLEFVAPEMLQRYPLADPGHFASGTIQSKASSNLCLEIPKGQRKVIAATCEKNLVNPSVKQFFKLSWHRNIQHFIFDFCLQDTMTVAECHFSGTNQYWKFDLVNPSIDFFQHFNSIIFLELFSTPPN